MRNGILILVLSWTLSIGHAFADQNAIISLDDIPEYVAPEPLSLSSTTLRVYDGIPEADQGVAVDAEFFYPVDNNIISKYRRDTGQLVDRFAVPSKGLIRHMNSCYARHDKLICANSNYSQTPMGSSIEYFDSVTMTHSHSHSLGLRDEGSLTWTDETETGFIAGFAHYSKKGGLPHKGQEYSSVISFDKDWRRTGGWLFPESVLEMMAPYAASGGALGPDGLLYILGHDKPEMYVLAKPAIGPSLIHVATIRVEAEGQAFSFTPEPEKREIWVIDRRHGKVRVIDLPDINRLPPEAKRFSR